MSSATSVPRIFSGPFTGDLCAAYLNAGHRVTAFCHQDSYGASEPAVYECGPLRLIVLGRRRPKQTVLSLWRTEIHELGRQISGSGVDVIHAHWAGEFALGAIASGLPHVVTVHEVPGKAFGYLRPRWYWAAKAILARQVARRVQLLTTNSPYTYERWRPLVPEAIPVQMISNAVPDWVWGLERKTAPADPREPHFAAANHYFTELKNVSNLIAAFQILKQQVPGARLRLYGTEFEEDGRAQVWARENRLEEGIEFRGNLPHRDLLTEIAGWCDAFVHPSLEESFGLVVAEAQAIGIPVVGGDRSGAIPWLLDGGAAGLLCDVTDTTELAKSMASALSEVGPSKVAAGLARAKNLYSYSDMTQRYLATLEESAHRRP